MKITKYDQVISSVARLRANFTCEAGDIFNFPECRRVDIEAQITYKSQVIQCSHFRGRGTGFIARHDIDNCRSLCAYCHSYVEHRPDDHDYFIRTLLGDRAYELLRERCNKSFKANKAIREDMYRHYKEQKDFLINERQNGNTKYIEVVNYF